MKIVALGLLVACGAPASPPVSPGDHHAVRDHSASITLTWLVHPAVPDPADPDGMPLAPLELVVGKEHIKLKPQLGSLKPYNQTVCPGDVVRGYPLEVDEVAKITFTEGGAGGYFVKRTPRGLALIEWNQSDGACPDPETGEPAACPRSEIEVQLLAAPANVQLLHRIVNVDEAGTQRPFDCSLD